jgi:hypothetical protein
VALANRSPELPGAGALQTARTGQQVLPLRAESEPSALREAGATAPRWSPPLARLSKVEAEAAEAGAEQALSAPQAAAR